jgi:hypothetical protein
VSCLEGSFSRTGDGKCSACPSGYRSNADHSSCESCPAGEQCADPTLGPQACPTGYWTGAGVTLECLVCPSGYYCPEPWSLPLACVPGTWSPEGSTSCSACSEGFKVCSWKSPLCWAEKQSKCSLQCLSPATEPVLCDVGYISAEVGGISLILSL